MPTVATYLVLAAAPAAAFWLARVGLERFARGPRHRSGAGSAGAPGAGRPLERLVADLRRLEGEYRRIERSDAPGRATRLRAVGLAYDDTLRSCCRVVGLPEPGRAPLSAVSRLQTEAALAQAGVTW